MITAKHILEIYKISKKTSDGELVVFENPTNAEKREASGWMISNALLKTSGFNPGYIRFLADAKNKKIFVWNAWASTHDDGRQLLGFGSQDNFIEKPWLLDGMATVTKSGDATLDMGDMNLRLEVFLRGDRFKKFLNQFFNYDWTWVDRYIIGFSQYWNNKKIKT